MVTGWCNVTSAPGAGSRTAPHCSYRTRSLFSLALLAVLSPTQHQPIRGQYSEDRWTNKKPVFRSRHQSGPIRGQHYLAGTVLCRWLDQLTNARLQMLLSDLIYPGHGLHPASHDLSPGFTCHLSSSLFPCAIYQS